MKPKIEEVEHSGRYSESTCCVVDYYPSLDSLFQANYNSKTFARTCNFSNTVGMWRIKTLKN